MKKTEIAWLLVAGLALGSFSAIAKLPAPAPMSDADKAAKAEKEKAAAAHDAAELDKARDRAVANYKKNKGIAEPKAPPATTSGKKK